MSLFDNKSNYIIRSTGEEVEVIASHKESESERSKEDWVSYIDSQGREHYKEHLNLDFDFRMSDKLAEHFAKLFDFPKPEPIKLPELPPHEVELRERVAMSAMQGMLSNPALVDESLNYRITIEEAAIGYADALIVKLKETSNETSGWKPSDEQMSALDAVIDEYNGYPEFDSLVSLKNDLKKLKG